MKLYHVSKVPNLKVLEPRISTHGKEYVYATTNLEFALFFGGKESEKVANYYYLCSSVFFDDRRWRSQKRTARRSGT